MNALSTLTCCLFLLPTIVMYKRMSKHQMIDPIDMWFFSLILTHMLNTNTRIQFHDDMNLKCKSSYTIQKQKPNREKKEEKTRTTQILPHKNTQKYLYYFKYINSVNMDD